MTMIPCIIVVREGVVSENILCRDAEHAERVFLDKLAECLSNWDEYDQDDRDVILENGYEQFGNGSVCLSWATSPDDADGKKGSPVAYNHLTVYYEPGYVSKPYCVNVDNPDNPDGTRNPGDEGHRFGTPKEVGKFVAEWLVERHDEKEPEGAGSPRAAIVQIAIEGLVEHYPQLNRKSVVESVRKQVKVPDTGNDQADYENVRNQIEVILNKQRS